MKIVSVKINNILSIESAEIFFDDSGLMLVEGWNHDVGRANGAGKTAIFNAITFALYDKLPRKVTAKEILRRGCKSGSVEVTVQIGDDKLIVKRSRPKGVVYSRGTMPLVITQDEWESMLKMSYDQFMKIAYCAQNTKDRFLSVNDADKKTFLLQLLNLEEFASSKKVADDKVKALTLKLETIKGKIEQAKSKIDAYSESLVDEDIIRSTIENNSASISQHTTELIQLQTIKKPDLSRYQKTEDDISAKLVEIAKSKTRREMLHDQYRRLNSKIKPFNDVDSCYACGALLDNSMAAATHKKEMEMHRAEALTIKEQIDACDLIIAKEKQIIELHSKLREKKREESKEYEAACRKISSLQKDISLKEKEQANLNIKLQNNSELQNKINALNEVCVKLLDSSTEINNKIDLYKTISSIYSPTGAQAYVLDSVVELFNERITEYINLLWSNLTYELRSYKENVRGEISAKFSESLVMDGKDISIGSLSGGEYRALSLCVDFALIDVMERQFGIYVSPIILDEPFDGLDSQGREVVIELLGKLSAQRQIVIVDHASEVAASFSNVLRVEKRNGISTVYMST